MSPALVVDILGWIGAAVILFAYGLVSLKKVEGDSLFFQTLNIGASILLVINTMYWRAYPSLALNAAWIVMGLVALGRKRWRKAGE